MRSAQASPGRARHRRRRKRLAAAALFWILFGLAAAPVAGAPRLEEEERITRLALGVDKGNPGNQIFIPVILSPAPGLQIAKVTSTIAYPISALRFEEALSSGLAELEVQAETAAGEASPGRSILKVTIQARPGEAMAGGILANLAFKILETAPMGETVILENHAEVFLVSEPEKPMIPAATNGEVRVVDVPVLFACYFYMH